MSFNFGFGLGLGRRLESGHVPVPTPDLVPLTAGGSLRFPENNNETSIPGFRGFLRQPAPADWFAGGGSAFCIIRFPRGRRVDGRGYKVYGTGGAGGGQHTLTFYGDDYWQDPRQRRFGFYLKDRASNTIDVTSAIWDEDAALVVMTWDGSSAYCDWYSLADGARHAGTPQAMPEHNGTNNWIGDFLIGGGATVTTETDIQPSGGYFPGEIAVLGHTSDAAVTVETWQAIAQGADPIATLGAANLPYYRRFDGTAATYGPPAAATADTSDAAVAVDGENLRPGSDFWRGETGLAFTPTGTRGVFGLLAGQTSRPVTFSGTAAAALEGETVEVQVFDAATGAIVLDWTSVGTIASGAWSGSVTVAKSSNGWVSARARIRGSDPEIVAWMFEPFAVGWKFALFGQSQMHIAATSNDRADLATPPFLASAGLRESTGKSPLLALVKSEDQVVGDGMVAFFEQMKQYGDTTPMQLDMYTEPGTSALGMIDDSDPDRNWSDVELCAGLWGAEATAVIWNWGTSDLGADWPGLYDAVFDGTGPAAADHDLSELFPAGFGRILSPLTRAAASSAGPYDSDDATDALGPYNDREEQIAYAEANGWTIGPYVYMQMPEGAGGPHQDPAAPRGNPLVGTMLAIAAARHIGLDTSTNPALAGTASFNEARTTITVPVTLPNGGTLTAEAPAAITGFEVNDGGATGPDVWTWTGFTAAISGSDIVLTKDGGSWAEGTKLRFMYGGPLAYGTAGPSETTLLDGVPHETYALNGLFGTLPLAGLGAAEITVGEVPDTVAPTLSGPTGAANGSSAATGSVTTDEDGGTLYWVCTTSAIPPSAAQVKAGQDSSGAAAASRGSQPVTVAGVQTLSPAPSGLMAETSHTLHFMHEDAASNRSGVASSSAFTTGTAVTGGVLSQVEAGTYAGTARVALPGNGGPADQIIVWFAEQDLAQAPEAPAQFTRLADADLGVPWGALYVWDGTGTRPVAVDFGARSRNWLLVAWEVAGSGIGASGVVTPPPSAGNKTGPVLTSQGADSTILHLVCKAGETGGWVWDDPRPLDPALPAEEGCWDAYRAGGGGVTVQVVAGPASAVVAITPASGTDNYGNTSVFTVEVLA